MNPSRLLVIDDHPEVAQVLKYVAEESGFRVIAVETPQAALDVIRMWQPDVICLDLVMPGVDGVELLEKLAEVGCRAGIIVISGMDAKVLESAHRVGAGHGLNMLGSLQKPLRIEDMEAMLEIAAADAAGTAVTEALLRRAIDGDSIEVHYQPKVILGHEGAGLIDGVEALMRLRRGSRDVVCPRDFLPVAEESGLLGALTDRVLEAGVAQLERWQRQGYRLNLSFNLSPQLLDNVGLPDRLARLCDAHDVEPQRICIEVSERVAMQDVALMTQTLTRFRLKGFRISMDDFGTGVSSLVQLYRMPFTELKVARDFVSAMKPGSDAEVIVRSIVELGRNLGLEICAQGVDREDALELLCSIDCTRAQGEFFSMPLAADALTELLRGWNPPRVRRRASA